MAGDVASGAWIPRLQPGSTDISVLLDAPNRYEGNFEKLNEHCNARWTGADNKDLQWPLSAVVDRVLSVVGCHTLAFDRGRLLAVRGVDSHGQCDGEMN